MDTHAYKDTHPHPRAKEESCLGLVLARFTSHGSSPSEGAENSTVQSDAGIALEALTNPINTKPACQQSHTHTHHTHTQYRPLLEQYTLLAHIT